MYPPLLQFHAMYCSISGDLFGSWRAAGDRRLEMAYMYILAKECISFGILTRLKLDLYDKNNLQNTLKIRILPETSILYLICYASIILIVGLYLRRRMQTSKHCWKKNSDVQWSRTSIVQHSRSSFRRSTICAITPIRSTGLNLAKCSQWIKMLNLASPRMSHIIFT